MYFATIKKINVQLKYKKIQRLGTQFINSLVNLYKYTTSNEEKNSTMFLPLGKVYLYFAPLQIAFT